MNCSGRTIDAGILKQEGEHLVHTDNYTLGSPSSAAAITVGNDMNGWETWKTEDGKTLDEAIRKAAAAGS